ncbi:MAG: zinc-dependent alcohol dehydrogenase family protein [Alphaproteobacteria bacterium]|nr:zinc-dependent alcohol dehydrogenase family protein [Alphaproteobacteria bacterium]
MRMKAAVLFEQGLPRPYTVSQPLKIVDVELDGPGEGEVLVEIGASGLCHSDLSALSGKRGRPLPTVVGHEGAGRVVELGKGVQTLSLDDHVVTVFVNSCGRCRYCNDGKVNLCQTSWKSRADGTLQSGGRRLRFEDSDVNHYSGLSTYAEYAVVSENSLVAIDKSVPLHVAALFGCAVVTGVGAVVNTAKVAPGRSAAVIGLGGVGLNAVLGLVAAGAFPIIAVDIKEEKLELALSLGASVGFLAREPEIEDRIKDLTRGGVDFAFEMAGSEPAMKLAYDITARGGMTVTAGLPDPAKAISTPHAALVSDERRVQGSYMGSCVPLRDIPRFIDMYMAGQLPVDRLHTGNLRFEELNEGFDKLADGRVVRQTLVPNERSSERSEHWRTCQAANPKYKHRPGKP